VSRIRRDVVVLVASLAAFAVCAVIAADGRVGPVERAAFDAVNGLPGWLYQPMLVFQYLGVLAMPLVVAVGALAFRRWRLAAALVLVVPCKLALERVVKLLVQRERPGTTVGDAILRGVHPGGLSFVSGHASSPSPSPGCWPWCCRAAGGRGVRAGHPERDRPGVPGAHNPLDVVGGAAIGLAIAAALDLVLDVARDRGDSRPGRPAPTDEDRAA
jgi:membrane-associated phospholipid phosphatase